MSLINDALKKAQKQRTGEAPSLASMPSVGGETPHRIAKRAKPAGFDTLIIRAGVGAGVLLLVVVGGYFTFRSDAEEKRSAVSDQPSASVPPAHPASPNVGSRPAVPSGALAQEGGPSPSPSPDPSSVLRPPSSGPQPAAAPTFNLPVAQVPVSEPQASRPTPQASVPSPAPAAPVQPTGSNPRVSPFSPPQAASPVAKPRDEPSVALAKEGAALKLEPRAIQFIENIKVAGIMARPTDSKVLMNDRVYRLGSIVEAELGLTLVGITTNSLTFEDERGGRYTRTF